MQRKPILLVCSIAAAAAVVGILATRLSAQMSTTVPCEDSDGGANTAVKGMTKGFHAMDGQYFSAIYGTEPDPGIPKKTTDNFSILYDYCYLSDGVVEGECVDGKLTSYGRNCPYGCNDGACKPAPADAPPSITLSVQPTTPTTWRPGGRGYFSWSAADDKGLQGVIITTSQMMYSSPTIDETWKCQGKMSCEENVYIIVPSSPGSQFVTVTATDSAGQTATKTVNFDAPACTANTDCGSSDIQWAGTSYCEKNGWIENRIMQYGVAAACESGICNTESLPRFKRQCQDAQVCTFDANGATLCVAQPMACSPNAQVTSACMCGGTALNYPVDWRARSPTYCCSGSDGIFHATSPGPCFASTSSVSSAASLPQQPTTSSVGIISPSASSAPQAAISAAAPVVPSPGMRPAAQSSSHAMAGDDAQSSARGKGGVANTAELQREWKLLKGKVSATRKQLVSVERNIASLEKKIDRKLRLLDQSKRKEVRKRVTTQIEKLEKKAASLEEKKEQLERELEGLRKRWEEPKAMVE